MDPFYFVWNAAASYVKLTLTLDATQETDMDLSKSPSKQEIMNWISRVGWEKLSCMDETLFMMKQEREEWMSEREETPSVWKDFICSISNVYEKAITEGEPSNLIWDHIISLALIAWDSQEGTQGIKQVAQTSDEELQGELRHIKEAIRALKRIRMAEMEPDAEGEGEGDADDGEGEADLDDEVLLGLQSKMKEMLGKIQDPNSGLGKLMMEIMEELKKENIELDTKSLMDVMMKSMMGGGGGLDALRDGPLGKIMAIVERKVKERIESGGMDDLKNILESTKDIFGDNPEEMKETLMKVLQNMVKKMGIPKQAQQMIFGQMNKVIEKLAKQFMSKDGSAPSQEDMQDMLQKNMNDVMMQFMAKQQGMNMSGRKARRMAARGKGMGADAGVGAGGGRRMRDPRLDRLEKLKERLRKRAEEKKRKDQA